EHPGQQCLDARLRRVETLDGSRETLIDGGLLLVGRMLGVQDHRQAGHKGFVLTETFLGGVVHPALLPRAMLALPGGPRRVPRKVAHSSTRTATHPRRRYVLVHRERSAGAPHSRHTP